MLYQGEDYHQKDDVKAKSLELTAVGKEVVDKSKFLTDRKVVPTLSPDDVKELTRHKQITLEM